MTDEKPTPAEKHMAKLTIGYRDYVLPVAEATKIMQCMEKAERYQFRYHRGDDGEGMEMHHVWSEKPLIGMELIDSATYLRGKFTGEPEDSV